MIEDCELLRRYVEDHVEAAFTELVQRHLDLVYSAALRQTHGDTHRSEDIAQTVFTDLARKAATLRRHPTLRGWLYTSTHFAAAKLARSESRRQSREKEAFVMQEILGDTTPAPDWNRLRPLLDGAMHELDERQREIILLRFFDQRPFADIAEKFGVSENAARKSVDRALENLGSRLAGHGITSTTGALAIALADHAVLAAPTGLASMISGSALAATIGGGGGFSVLQLMATTKLKIGIIGILAIGAAVLVVQRQSNAALANEISRLREQLQPPPPARAQAGLSAPAATESVPARVGALPTPHSPAGEMREVSTWKNAGRATPADFMETYFWSIKQMDLDGFVATWGGLDEAGERMAKDYFEALPAETRAKYGTAERLIAKLMMWAQTVHPITGFQITDVEMLGPDEASPHIRLRLLNGDEQMMKPGSNLYRTRDGWRSGPLPAMNVEKALYEGRYLLKFENLPSPPRRTP